MLSFLRFALLLLLATPALAERRAPVTILVSIDGFRADYLDRGLTPRLHALAANGVRAAMRPSFPSITFPNHWTLVTGLVPDHHGIVANKMEDPARPGEQFDMKSDDPFWWNAAMPIWADAEKAGVRTATMFWPGSNVQVGGFKRTIAHDKLIIGGTRPADWMQFNAEVKGPQRVQAVMDWLRRPGAIRPRFITLYFDTIDTAGHHHGPDSPELNAALVDIDRTIGGLIDGLAALRQPANLVIVADHGMAAVRPDGLILTSALADPADFRAVEKEPIATLYAVPGREAALERALLAHHDHVQCWRKAEMPVRFRYGTNPRIASYVCLADIGWTIASEAPKDGLEPGAHGYDNQAPEMRALFIANGPAFRAGRTLPIFDNVAVEPLLRDLIGLPPHQVDGTDAVFRSVLKR
ncbi:putative AlkP superfamily pyrophosphatase or phosphodiesterase [Sphingomonas vulcanisoli]|uniref:AlkP superfamily pyrophosphatase or phosphodiesterase n=1 Tax=Sphingomonas vulcanisoli TaxID=1658060 RepID=A0ABX0TMA4_9SPHN|nr:ectonucleotide pyrophosphatase/phosphodiesterase [Sphingomonas vulcanisoli]NIJ06658.1 putative AlkP superfamily pyrophosphatase or phosphodiesterase [Sphingomonas vulcanisoli]